MYPYFSFLSPLSPIEQQPRGSSQVTYGQADVDWFLSLSWFDLAQELKQEMSCYHQRHQADFFFM